jgi:hypothetical protein
VALTPAPVPYHRAATAAGLHQPGQADRQK